MTPRKRTAVNAKCGATRLNDCVTHSCTLEPGHIGDHLDYPCQFKWKPNRWRELKSPRERPKKKARPTKICRCGHDRAAHRDGACLMNVVMRKKGKPKLAQCPCPNGGLTKSVVVLRKVRP